MKTATEAPLKVRRDDGPYGRYAHLPQCNPGCTPAEHWLYTGERFLPRAEAAARARDDGTAALEPQTPTGQE